MVVDRGQLCVGLDYLADLCCDVETARRFRGTVVGLAAECRKDIAAGHVQCWNPASLLTAVVHRPL